MCLIAIAFKTQINLPLVVVANRDEFNSRPSAAMHWWSTQDILAGRDLRGGGTWLGVSSTGRFAALTNYRGSADPPHSLSRGHLVSNFLASTQPAWEWSQSIRSHLNRYCGFNLLMFDGQKLFYINNVDPVVISLKPNIYGLSNHGLDSDWPKVHYAKKRLQQRLNRASKSSSLDRTWPDDTANLLCRRSPYERQRLPDTGIPKILEKRLSAPFITGKDYGTRASTAVVIRGNGAVSVVEHAHLNGELQGTQRFNYQL